MSVRRSSLARVSRGTATLSAAALLMSAGLFTPAYAAETEKFTPTVSVKVAPLSQLGEDIPVTVHLDASAGQEWTETEGKDVELVVRLKVNSESEGSNDISTVVTTAEKVFRTDKGPGDYTLEVEGPLDNVSGITNTYTASVLVADGDNTHYIDGDVVTDSEASEATTKISFLPKVTGTVEKTALTAGDNTQSGLKGTGFNNKTLDVMSTLYGPFKDKPAESASAPADANVVGATLNSFSGGDAYTSTETLVEPGFYVWHHTIDEGQGAPAYSPAFATSENVINVKAAPKADTPEPVTSPAPPPPSSTTPGDTKDEVYYENCDAVKKAGVGPLKSSDPGYRAALDGDGDGVACEDAVADGVGTGSGTDSGNDAGAGTAGGFANCTEAREAGYFDIAKGDPMFVADQDADKDGTACESNGSDAAVAIDGGFVQASSADNTPFIAGGIIMILLALGLGTSVIVRSNRFVK